MLKINGELLDLAGTTVADYLAGSDYDARRIAVEINGLIVPKRDYGTAVLRDGDTVEIVSFVGGG
ncbi:MAG: sulfur carrier protein ThiS [Firmicutes bacterium]|nr:sulfur carrier protein ThiS [Bacillota bacterium]